MFFAKINNTPCPRLNNCDKPIYHHFYEAASSLEQVKFFKTKGVSEFQEEMLALS